MSEISNKLGNGKVESNLNYELGFELRIKIEAYDTLSCLLPFVDPPSFTFSVQYVPQDPLASTISTFNTDLILKDGYEVLDQNFYRSPHTLKYDISGILGILNQLLGGSLVDSIFEDFKSKMLQPITDYLIPTVDTQMGNMIVKMYKNSHFIHGTSSMNYFKKRVTNHSNIITEKLLDITSDHFEFLTDEYIHQIKIPMLLSEISPDPFVSNIEIPFTPISNMVSNQTSLQNETLQANSLNIYKRMLRLIRQNFNANDYEMEVLTRAEFDPINLKLKNGIIADNIQFDMLDPSNSNDLFLIGKDNYAKLSSILNYELFIDGSYVENILFQVVTPLKNNNIYRNSNEEFLNDVEKSIYEERLTPDSAHTSIQIISCYICDFVNTPIPRVDLELILKSLVANEIGREFHALGAMNVGKNANIGDHWGTMKYLVNILENYGVPVNFDYPTLEGFNLNLGSFIPESRPTIEFDNNNLKFSHQINSLNIRPFKERLTDPEVNICTIKIPNSNGSDKFGAITTIRFATQIEDGELATGEFLSTPGAYGTSPLYLIVDQPITARVIQNPNNFIGSLQEDCDLGEVQNIINDSSTRKLIMPNLITNTDRFKRITSITRHKDTLVAFKGCNPEVQINFSYDVDVFTSSSYFTGNNQQYLYRPIDSSKNDLYFPIDCSNTVGSTNISSLDSRLPSDYDLD